MNRVMFNDDSYAVEIVANGIKQKENAVKVPRGKYDIETYTKEDGVGRTDVTILINGKPIQDHKFNSKNKYDLVEVIFTPEHGQERTLKIKVYFE